MPSYLLPHLRIHFARMKFPGNKVLFPQKFTFKMDVELKSRKTNTLGTDQGSALGLFWVRTSPWKKRRGWQTLGIEPRQLRHVPRTLKYSKFVWRGFIP